MSSRVKEDEKHERIIRGLLKLPANKRCINCNNLGPQYVCTNFWTFVCTNCSGAHREFTHRVKSVSMAKFTAQEVTALQEGGNERAREIFFKEWDPHRNAYPESSNSDKLRNFIKHVYVERRYTGERSTDRPPRGKDDKDEYSENRRSDGNWGGSRSPPNGSYSDRRSYSGRSDDRNSRYSYGDRSPGYDQNDYKKSPRYFEVVDDRSGKTTPVQRFEDRRFSEPRKPGSGSPNFQKEADGSSPVVRPMRDILGDDAPQLRVGEPSKPAAEPPKPSVARPIDPPKPSVPRSIDPPKPNGTRASDPPPLTKTMSSASSIASSEGTSEQMKVSSAVSLIDFSADPESTASGAPPQPTPTPLQHPVNAPAPQPVLEQGKSAPSVSGGDWASFDAFGQQQIPQTGSSANPLESALAQLSFSETPSAPNMSAFPALDPSLKANDGRQSSMVDQSHSSLFDVPVGISGNQASAVMSIQGSSVQQFPLAAPAAGLPSQVTANPQGTSGIQGSASSTDSKSIGRKELPADIFTALYPTAAPMMPGWQRAPQFGMGYAMQYPAGMGMQAYPQGAFPQPTYQQPVYPQHAYPQPVKASNPFDLGNEPAPIQAHMPLSGPLGASAGTAPQTLLGTSSFGIPPQQPRQLYQPAAPPSHFMTQQVPNSMPEQPPNSMHATQQGGLGSFNMGFDQQAPRYSQPRTPPSYGSVGGNPFG
ncbi:probable ADP-ribosylation factor GTPase-activating protein AGD14 isoform X2 [Phragmites australis]|uniref:probable ADP-ribosylation factor GTPase-activating protein AGD14 isoform X2 n=1 Tax=Phragmites australis TaxID=29695 RepID=UPI002D7705AF|nr:probable ADP-ribosylation factor GTPase-activating protein AGD14 isoform X2 [Phragmites australis]